MSPIADKNRTLRQARRVARFGRCARACSLVVMATLAGCLSLPPQAPFDLSQHGWTIQVGQAVWHPGQEAMEIAGDLLVATHPDGRSLVQFTKPPLPFVSAQRTARGWHAQFFAQKKSYSAPGRPPDRILWFHLPEALAGRLAPGPWSFTLAPEDHWRLENRSTKESLDGYLKTTRAPSSN